MAKYIFALWIFAVCFSGVSFSADVPSAADADTLYKAGRAAFEDGMYDLAEGKLKAYLAIESTPPDARSEAYISLIRTLYKQNRYADILALYKNDSDEIRKLPGADAFLYWRLAAMYETGEYQSALKGAHDFEKKHGSSSLLGPVKRLKAWCRLKMGDRASAIQDLLDASASIADGPEKAVTLIELSKMYAAAGYMDKALEAALELKKIEPSVKESHEGMYWLSTLLADSGRSNEAVPLLKAMVTNDSVANDIKVRSCYRLGRLYAELKNPEQALNSITNGILLAYDKSLKNQGQCELGLYYLSQGSLTNALPILKDFVRKDTTSPVSGEVHLKMAKALLEAGQSQQAADEYQNYIETFTNAQGNADAYMGKGWALYKIERYAEAATCFTKAYSLFTYPAGREQSLFKAADSYAANGQYNLAVSSYKSFINEFHKSESLVNALFQIADSYARLEDLKNALVYYQRVIANFPESRFVEESMFRVADILAKRKEYEEAVKSYNAVMERFTNGVFVADALFGRGMISFEQGRHEQAISDFESVRKGYGSTSSAEGASFMTGISYFKLGKPEDSIAVFRDFIVKYPQSKRTPEVLFWIGKHEYNAQRYEESAKYFLQIHLVYPGDEYADDSLLRAGLALSKCREYVKANDVLNKLADSYPTSAQLPEARFAQADVLFELGKLSPSILIYDELINKYPASELVPAALMRKGDCQFTLGVEDPARYAESVKSFMSVVNHPKSTPDLILQANYKIGRCHEKSGKSNEAVEQYYQKVIVPYLDAAGSGAKYTESSALWFTRAAFSAADILEERKDLKQEVNVLQRVVNSGVPAAAEAKERISKIKATNWWMFY